MGTRSTYRIIERAQGEEKPIALIYMQYDGYPDGHPLETAQFLENARVLNGFMASDANGGAAFNGAGCLAARLVARLKGNSIGNCYLYSLVDRGNLSEDYMYDIIAEVGKPVEIVAYDYNEHEIFRGTAAEFVDKHGVTT